MSTKSLRRKKHDKYETSFELSTNKLTPGIIKIFGGNVSQGSNYKAVRASSISTAQEVVRNALDKYALESCNPKDYVLCDVVGEFTFPNDNQGEKKTNKKVRHKRNSKIEDVENQPVWNAIYVRAINDIEKPLILQSLWKPADGKSRRFELRKRIEVETSCFFINTSVSMGRRDSDISLFDYSDNSFEDVDTVVPYNLGSPKISSKHDIIVDPAPASLPYLLLLKGYHPSDKLIHLLQSTTLSVGSYIENSDKQCDIALYSPDSSLQVGFVHKRIKNDNNYDTNVDNVEFEIFVEPCKKSYISVNGVDLLETTILQPGQLITFGEHYLFLFKDPTCIKDVDLSLSWMEKIKEVQAYSNSGPNDQHSQAVYSSTDQAVQVELGSFNTVDIETDDESDNVSSEESYSEMQKPSKFFEKSQLQLAYNIREEDNFLHSIIEITDEELEEFGVIPAYFFLMAIEHSAASFTEIQTRKLLLKIASGMQGIAWEKTKDIGKHPIKRQSPIILLQSLLSELKIVLFWMTNTLEMLHYLQCNLKKYLLPRSQVGSNQEAILTADEELLSVLEEVIMFTFQQTVYHLTKVLYVTLPAIIDKQDGEIVDINNEKHTEPSVTAIADVFTEILHSINDLHVHPQIVSQLFAYLFFFSNASLFNYLIEKGPAYKIFSWLGGVQLKNNINVIEDWAHVNNLGDEFNRYMLSFLSAVDLLSTPKSQIIQFNWKDLRAEYPALKPAQLQFLLGEYELNGMSKPRGWYPVPEEVERALQSNELLESFATHPPLVLPSSEFIVDLHQCPPNDQFSRYLSRLNEKFDKKDSPIISDENNDGISSCKVEQI